MISDKIQTAFNGQLNAEVYSAYMYWSMSAWFEEKGLKGFAHWLRCQAQEEMEHAMKFHDFVIERGGKVLLTTIEGPPTAWESPLAIFQTAYEHECKVTGLIDGLVELASEAGDNAAGIFLQWFVTEQVEEESSTLAVVDQIKLVGDQGPALMMLDRALAQRDS